MEHDPRLDALIDKLLAALIAKYSDAAQAGRACGVDPSYLSKWADHANYPSVHNLRKITRACPETKPIVQAMFD